jgi:hypothetical protein
MAPSDGITVSYSLDEVVIRPMPTATVGVALRRIVEFSDVVVGNYGHMNLLASGRLVWDEGLGRYTLRRLTIEPDPTADEPVREITTAALRTVAVTRILGLVGASQSVVMGRFTPDGLWTPLGTIENGGLRRLGDMKSDDVAVALYLVGAVTGTDSNEMVQAAAQISRSAAAQRIARLRRQGLLPPTTKGKRSTTWHETTAPSTEPGKHAGGTRVAASAPRRSSGRPTGTAS